MPEGPEPDLPTSELLVRVEGIQQWMRENDAILQGLREPRSDGASDF